jgi:hypothetical protein
MVENLESRKEFDMEVVTKATVKLALSRLAGTDRSEPQMGDLAAQIDWETDGHPIVFGAFAPLVFSHGREDKLRFVMLDPEDQALAQKILVELFRLDLQWMAVFPTTVKAITGNRYNPPVSPADRDAQPRYR